MKRLLITFIICIMCFCDVVPAMAAGGALYDSGAEKQQLADSGESDGTSENTQVKESSQGDAAKAAEEGENASAAALAVTDSSAMISSGSDGTVQKNLPEGELLFITLAEDHRYRWNVNDSAEKNSVVHLDDASGKNCNFKLKHVGDEWYGIKHIKDNGVDRYADIEDKSTDKGKKLHLWEDSDDKVSGNNHRQFAFYYVGLDDNGNEQFYIKNRNSGLWMGYEDTDKNGKPSYGDKIIQTDTNNRELWIVTPETVPMVGGEDNDLLDEGDTTAYCEMFQKDTINSINRSNDAAFDGTGLHFYEMGTSSKWRLEYVSKYAAYEIHAITDGEADRNNKVWDVDGESGNDGAYIWLWGDQSKDINENTSQLWRFIKQNNGSYKIMNVRSGKYVNCTQDSGSLIQKSDGTEIWVDVFAGSAKSVNFDYSQDWMSVVPDGALLSSVNIPGTHDTGTAAVIEDAVPTLSLTSCQKYYYGEQLNVGIRSFDVRCNATKTNATAGDVNIIHGSELWQCYDRDGSKLTLKSILDDSVRFLSDDKHKSETLIIMLKPDAGSTEGLARAVGDFIKNNGEYVYKGGGIPSMGEARGKIVFIRRYDIDTSKYNPANDGLKEEWFGINLSDWDTHSYGNYKYAINIYDKDGTAVYAQDAYNEYSSGKWDYVKGTLEQTTGKDTSHAIPADAWIYNYTSCAVGFPLGLTRDINPKLFYDKADCIDSRRLGMVMMNFVDRPMSRLIYETNKSDSSFYATKAIFPNSISITYGDKLSQANMTWPTDADGNLQDGDGTWTFEDGNYVPTAEDINKHKTFKLTYTPYDTRLKPVTKEVLITQFWPKQINVKIDDKEMIYGDAVPELTYSVTDTKQLVNGDSPEDLDIDLMLDPYPTDLSAGKTYAIKGIPRNANYSVKLENGTLKINKKTVGIKWSNTKNLVYTGQPVNVTAELTGVLAGDECNAVVKGGDATEPSWDGTSEKPTKYTATVTGLTGKDSGNYQLPDDNSVDYYIRRADADDFAFPQKAVLTYGQKLSEADLVGASGSGEFIFIDKTTRAVIDDTIPSAVGVYTYTIAYVPENTDVQHATMTDIDVIVNCKPITAEAVDKEKTYGEPRPGLTYTVDPSQLVNGDTEQSLGLTLTAGEGDKQYCDAGKYKIEKKDCTNKNYDVTVKPAVLTVSRRPVNINWPADPQYTYSGKAVNMTEYVSVSNLVNNDTCDIAILGGVAVNVGKYNAVAVALSNRNYCLPENIEDRVCAYEIIKADPAGVTFPTSATLTYGQTLDQAELSGQSGDGTFAFQDGSELLKASDSGNTRTMIFTPKDSDNYNSIHQEVPVTVNKKPLSIEADDKEKKYGQETPELTWYMDESQLVAGDSIDEFRLELAVAGEGNDQYCDVGGYEITGKIISQNENYDVKFSSGTLKVDPLMVSFRWNVPYNIHVGDPAPSAQIMNLVQAGDDCSLVVESDGTANASWTEGSDKVTVYNAEITGLTGEDKYNYTLPDEDLTRSYLVLRTAADCSMPKAAVMTYGQTLDQAEFMQAAGNGTFEFVKGEGSSETVGSEMPQSAGISKYTVKFTPDDKNAKSVWAEIPVIVKPKKITAYAENAEKIYGEETELSFTVDESQLVGSDTVESLGLTLTAGKGDERYCDIGRYEIDEASCTGTDYDVTVIPAELTVKRRPITVSANDRQKTYGQKTPRLTWYMDESQLVGGDSIDEFKLILTAGEGNDQYCNAGDYDITLKSVGKQNGNYAIEFNNGTLKVDPLMIAFEWVITNKLEVGDPAPSARIMNLVQPDDDCSIVVESDGTSKASWTEGSDEIIVYNAEITGLAGADSGNYILPDEDLTRQYLVRRKDSTDCNMPKAAIMTYGQTLDEAELILASGDGEFTFVEKDGSQKDIGDTMPPGAGEFKFTVKFTPADENEKSEWSQVTVLVRPKKITAYADDTEKTYGEKTRLSYTIDESQLVGSDTEVSLGLTLTAVSTEGADKPDGNRIKSPVGTYDIVQKTVEETRDATKSNYDVTVVPGILTIHPKVVSLEWSDVSSIYYTGKPAGVTAKAEGLIKGDTCDVTVINGDRTEPGTYTALAVALSNGNYILPRDRDQLMKEYTIQKAQDPTPTPGDSDNNGGNNGNGGNGAAGNDAGARTSDPVNLTLMLALCILAVSSGTAVAALLRKNKSK